MSSILDRISQSVAGSRAIGKFASGAGEGCCAEQSGSPESLITGAAKVTCKPDKNIPGNGGFATNDNLSTEGVNVGDVERTQINVAPEGVDVETDSDTVKAIVEAQENFIKSASGLYALAEQLFNLPDEVLDGAMAKNASAAEDTHTLIIKRASAGDAAAKNYLEFCQGYNSQLRKMSSEVDELVAEGIDPMVAEAAVTEAAMEEAGMSAPQAGATELTDEEIIRAVGAQLESEAAQLAQQAADELVQIDPSLQPEEAIALGEQLVAEKINEVVGGEEGDYTIVDHGGIKQSDLEAIADSTVGEAMTDDQILEAVTLQLAEQIVQADPSATPEEAIEVASEAVSDALDTALEQQAIAEVDAEGEPLVDDATAVAAIEDMVKTASANPLRGELTMHINRVLGLNPGMFASRVQYLAGGR